MSWSVGEMEASIFTAFPSSFHFAGTRKEKPRMAPWGFIGRMGCFMNHLRLPGGIGKAGSKAAFHQGQAGVPGIMETFETSKPTRG